MAMRIDPTQQPKSAPLETAAVSSRPSEFNQTLAQRQKLQHQELEQFLARLDAQGEKLAQSLSWRDLVDFRDMIKTMLRSTFGQSRTMQEDSFWDYRGRPKVMSRIKQIDNALEELGQSILDKQSKSLEILTKIGEIRGLIIDLLA